MKNKNLMVKPPVVVVLGHIDSGKTTLLDQIRKANVAEKESGGITQHIGAYQIEKDKKKITFIDTPGHEAFSQMRSRGAKTADIAVLVIDSCKGVEEQTKEVITHIREAEIPVIVALNKMDRPEADPERAKRELQKENITTESLGGKVPSVNISAKTGNGIEGLLDLILLVAEMEELKTDFSKTANGVIIESYQDSQRGPTGTLILSEGILKNGDIVGTPSVYGKVKILEDFKGEKVSEIKPGDPAVFLGLESVPMVGEKLQVFSDPEEAKRNLIIKDKTKLNLEKESEQKIRSDQKILNIIFKADVLGSIEAIVGVLKKLPQEKVIIKILKAEVGDINENDVKLSQNSKAIIVGFRVDINPTAKKWLQREEIKVKVMNFEIIYELVEGIKKFMEKIVKPAKIRTDLGKVKVLVTFWNKKNRQIVGGRITEGAVEKRSLIEVLRNDEVVEKGKMVNLQKNKKDIERALRGEEIGVLYEGEKKIEKGDELIIYKEEKSKVEL